jgi:iron(III) transport system substrate-binding protein
MTTSMVTAMATTTRTITASRRALIQGVCAALSAPWVGSLARAQGVSADVALYAGADRMQRLIEGAKKEGVVSLYASAPPDDLAGLTNAFSKKYDIKVRLWRSSSENVLQRGVAEARAGRFEADVFETNGTEMEFLQREKILQEVKSPLIADIAPAAVLPHREWIGTRVNAFVAAYNTKLVRKDELPKSYADLADPRWKGRLGIEANDFDWFAAVMKALGEEQGLKLFRDIAERNGLSMRKGHTLLANLVISGEVPFALTVYQYKAEQLKNSGAPIDWLALSPTMARLQGIGLSRRAPHPHAAVLFIDFMLSEGQDILAKRDFSPTNQRLKSALAGLPLKMMDADTSQDEGDKWQKLFRELATARPR